MCVSETGGSLLHRLHTALIVALSAEEERELGSRVNKNSQTGKRGGWGGGKEGREVVDTAHCHCYPSPSLKIAASIKPLMILALCHGSVRERDQNV